MSLLAVVPSPKLKGSPAALVSVLLVDDDDNVRSTLTQVLRINNFEVTPASNVNDAIRLMMAGVFDVLLTDLHTPDTGAGLTVVSAMKSAHPHAVTMVLSGYPEMKEAAAAIILQADEILNKPIDPRELVNAIRAQLQRGARPRRSAETVAQILETETGATIADWNHRVDAEPAVISVPLTQEERTAHLPRLFYDIVVRLRIPLPLGTRALVSPSASAHGITRYRQGYTAAMMVEESRMLQVSVFQTLQNNLHKIDFSLLLIGVMAIADEIDSQLAQAMTSFVIAARQDLP